MLTNKQLGIILVVLSVILLVLGLVYVKRTEGFILSQAKTGPQGECIHDGPVCPYQQISNLAIPKYSGLFLLIIMFVAGVYLFLKKKPEEVLKAKARKEVKNLGKEEAQVYDFVAEQGMIFQNELVEKTQLSKVKITRILDRLEAKGMVERKRRGMTNVVVLK